MSELERLFVTEPVPLPPVQPQLPCHVPVLPSRDEDVAGSLFDLRGDAIAPRLWEDFERNGTDRELDDMDKIMRSMTQKERKPR